MSFLNKSMIDGICIVGLVGMVFAMMELSTVCATRDSSSTGVVSDVVVVGVVIGIVGLTVVEAC